MNLAYELRSTGKAMRGKGVMIIVGGRGGQYQEIYSQVTEILCSAPYRTSKFRSRLRNVPLLDHEMSYSLADEYGELIRGMYQKVLLRVEMYNALGNIDLAVLKTITAAIDNPKQIRWALHIFRKEPYTRIPPRDLLSQVHAE